MKSPAGNICLLHTGGRKCSRLSSIQSSSLNGIVVFIFQRPCNRGAPFAPVCDIMLAASPAGSSGFERREPSEVGWRQCFGACLWIYAHGGDRLGRQPSFQCPAERLAPHREQVRDEA